MEEKVKKILSEQFAVRPEDIRLEANLAGHFGMDELDSVELNMAVEETFGIEIPTADWEKINTVKDIIEYVKEALDA